MSQNKFDDSFVFPEGYTPSYDSESPSQGDVNPEAQPGVEDTPVKSEPGVLVIPNDHPSSALAERIYIFETLETLTNKILLLSQMMINGNVGSRNYVYNKDFRPKEVEALALELLNVRQRLADDLPEQTESLPGGSEFWIDPETAGLGN